MSGLLLLLAVLSALVVGGVVGFVVGSSVSIRPLLRRRPLDPLDDSYKRYSSQIRGRIP